MNNLTLQAPQNLSLTNLGDLAGNIYLPVFNGEQSPLSVYIKVKAFQKVLDTVATLAKQDAIVEARQYGKTDSNLHGVTFQVRNGHSKYDFSPDPEWANMNDRLDQLDRERKKLKEKMKRRERRLIDLYWQPDPRTGEIKSPITMLDNWGSETIALYFQEE